MSTPNVENLPEAAQAAIAKIREREAADPRGAVTISDAAKILGLSPITIRKKVAAGEIVSWLDGRARRIPVSEIYGRQVDLIVAGYRRAG
jgi:excisionase family DNA binding protein